VLPENYVETLEAELGCRLPADYLEFIRAFPLEGACWNGAFIELPEGEEGPSGKTLEWSTLHGYDAKPTWGLVPANRNYPDHHVEDMIAIGDDIAGNILYMGVNGTGGVYFKDRDKSERMTREEMCFVRPTFEAFILDTCTDEEDEPLTPEEAAALRPVRRTGMRGAWDRLRRKWREFW